MWWWWWWSLRWKTVWKFVEVLHDVRQLWTFSLLNFLPVFSTVFIQEVRLYESLWKSNMMLGMFKLSLFWTFSLVFKEILPVFIQEVRLYESLWKSNMMLGMFKLSLFWTFSLVFKEILPVFIQEVRLYESLWKSNMMSDKFELSPARLDQLDPSGFSI